MTRDMKVVKGILAILEASAEFETEQRIYLQEYSADRVAYHVLILSEGGYIDPEARDIYASRLTYAGHDLLDDLRKYDPPTWNAPSGGWKDSAERIDEDE